MNSERLIFCMPGGIYRGKSELQVAEGYTKMAIIDYDKLISFGEEYMPFVEVPDYEEVVSKKNGRNLLLTLFSQQKMIRVGGVKEDFISSSYLFNPSHSLKEDLLLPDLDIVQISGESFVDLAVKTIGDFYKRRGWEFKVIKRGFPSKKSVKLEDNWRGLNKLEIFDPLELLVLSQDLVGYDPSLLCWN